METKIVWHFLSIEIQFYNNHNDLANRSISMVPVGKERVSHLIPSIQYSECLSGGFLHQKSQEIQSPPGNQNGNRGKTIPPPS